MKLTASLLGVLASLAAQAQEQEVIVACAIVRRPAFYEVAPTYLATSMHAAVQRECAAKSNDKSAVLNSPELQAAAEWLCASGPFYFLRGVYQLGEEGEDGFVCKGDAEWRYYRADVFEENEECIAVWYDVDQKMHSIE